RVTLVTASALIFASGFNTVLTFGLTLWLALQVSRFYLEGRKTGFLELLLVTPVGPSDIIRGHWLGLRRLFLLPVALSLTIQLTTALVQAFAIDRQSGFSALGGMDFRTIQLVASLLGAASWLVGLAAVAAFSMWMAVTSQKIMTAVLKTYVFVKIIPYIVAYIGMALISFGLLAMMGSGSGVMWYYMFLPSLLISVIEIGILVVSQRRMRSHFRKFVCMDQQSNSIPPPLKPFQQAPPPLPTGS